MCGETKAEPTDLEEKQDEAKAQVRAWMRSYHKNRWENQPIYPEILIEKKALEGVFAKPCRNWDIAVGACKGYPSLTFLFELSERLREAQANGKQCIILYFGDTTRRAKIYPGRLAKTCKSSVFLGSKYDVLR